MRIFLTGVEGCIGKRLLFELFHLGHEVICSTRSSKSFPVAQFNYNDIGKLVLIENDFRNSTSLHNIPKNIDAAYYLLNSFDNQQLSKPMTTLSAMNFCAAITQTNCRQVIFLSEKFKANKASTYLEYHTNVEKHLKSHKYALTTLRSGIIVGSGSTSFEIVRGLVEKQPLLIGPGWMKNVCQPISIVNVIQFLGGVLFNTSCYNRKFDICGPERISVEDLFKIYALQRGFC